VLRDRHHRDSLVALGVERVEHPEQVGRRLGQVAALPGVSGRRVAPDGRLSLVALIAEGVLLTLPLVPVDPESTRLEPEPGRSDTHRPFEALADLKKKSR